MRLSATTVYDLLGEDFFLRATHKDAIGIEEDWKNIRLLTSYNKKANLEFVYASIKVDNKVYLIASSATDEEIKNNEPVHYFYDYDSAQKLVEAFDNDKIVYENFSDEWGTFRAAHVPISLPSGTKVVVSADMSINAFNKHLMDIKYQYFFEALLYLLLSIPIMIAIYYSIKEKIKIEQKLKNELSEKHKKITQLDRERKEEEENKKRVSQLLDAQQSIVILMDNQTISMVNLKFHQFFNTLTINEFKERYLSLGATFKSNDNQSYIQEYYKNKHWVAYIKENADEVNKVRIKSSDEKYHVFKIDINAYSDKNSHLDVITLSDITDIEHLEEEIKKNQKLLYQQSKMAAMGEMISMIAHQWRQPITSISMAANNISADIDLQIFNEDDAKKLIQLINKQTQYLSKTIDDFRSFFKPKKNKKTLPLKEIFDETLMILSPSLQHKNIKLEIESHDSITITTHTNELTQVLINLIKNAQDAFDEKDNSIKEINIMIQTLDNAIHILICDNAGGIPQQYLNKIFEPYFTTKQEKNGTGLGLYMSKLIVEKHLHGTLEANNSDIGACFTISIPSSQ